MLVAVPAELFAQPFFVGEPETGAIGSPKAHAFPALGFERFVKQPGAEEEHVLEKFRQELLAGLNQGAFCRRRFSAIKPIKKSVKFNTKRTFEKRNVEPRNSFEVQDAGAGKIFPRPGKVLLGALPCQLWKLPDGVKISTEGGVHD